MKLSKVLFGVVAGFGLVVSGVEAACAQQFFLPPPPAIPQAAPQDAGTAVLSVINDTRDQLIIHINDVSYGWLRPGETRDIRVSSTGKTVVYANAHDGDLYVQTLHKPVGYFVWYINEGRCLIPRKWERGEAATSPAPFPKAGRLSTPPETFAARCCTRTLPITRAGWRHRTYPPTSRPRRTTGWCPGSPSPSPRSPASA